MPTPARDIAGQRFGRLTGLHFTRRDRRQSYWLFKCDCGHVKEIRLDGVTRGMVRSCGCLQREAASAAARRTHTKHGGSHTPEYGAWQNMRDRCSRPANKYYADYGGRGIRVCSRWDNFVDFLADMGARPSAAHSLDRIDVNGNYAPENCRWATQAEQHANRRRLRDSVARIAELEAEVAELRRLILGA